MTQGWKSHIITRIGRILPPPILGKLARVNIVLPYYHMVSNENVSHVKYLYKYKNVRQFREDIDFLLKHYSPVSLKDLVHSLRGDKSLPRNTFLLTFDDGFREMHDIVAPILVEKGVHATFFVNSAFVDNRQLCHLNKASILAEKFEEKRSLGIEKKVAQLLRDKGLEFNDVVSALLSINYQNKLLLDDVAKVMEVDFGDYLSLRKPYLTTDQIRQLLHNGFTIGAHSIDHPYYGDLTLTEQLNQTIESARHIRENFQLDYGAFAFPHGDSGVSKEFFKRIQECGLIDITFGTGGMGDGYPRTHRQRFSLEKPLLPARDLLTWQYARRFYRQLRWGNDAAE